MLQTGIFWDEMGQKEDDSNFFKTIHFQNLQERRRTTYEQQLRKIVNKLMAFILPKEK